MDQVKALADWSNLNHQNVMDRWKASARKPRPDDGTQWIAALERAESNDGRMLAALIAANHGTIPPAMLTQVCAFVRRAHVTNTRGKNKAPTRSERMADAYSRFWQLRDDGTARHKALDTVCGEFADVLPHRLAKALAHEVTAVRNILGARGALRSPTRGF